MMVYSSSQRHMAPKSPKSPISSRPATNAVRRSSSPAVNDRSARDPDGADRRRRAQTQPAGLTSVHPHRRMSSRHDGPDVFATSEETETPEAIEVTRASVELDSLPIELISLIDSFIESLGAKVHSTPPNVEKTSRLFQDFYALASGHVNTHVDALGSRRSRDVSPAPSASSISSAASRLRSTLGVVDSANSGPKNAKLDAEQQMITAEELEARKAERKAHEAQRSSLEEAVERRLCEGIYDRIYRHRSTEDEALDDQLRSKTAALALMGIGPADLGLKSLDLSSHAAGPEEEESSDVKKPTSMEAWLDPAMKNLVKMSDARYPLGKLAHLKAAHKSIVEMLASTHPTASADDILPVLILTLTIVPPEKLHVVSDLHFIQYFRWEPKLTGEAAYCLTNMEAAITFLQELDLATIRGCEETSGSAEGCREAEVPKVETFPAYSTTPSATSSGEADNAKLAAPIAGLKAATVLRNRRLSDIVNRPAQALGLASDAVLNTADQGFKNISSSLGDSYKFLLGKIKERQDGLKESITIPRTLDDARRLVSTPDDDAAGSVVHAGGVDYLKRPAQRDDRVLSLLGGRRDRSADSARSGRSVSSSKKVVFADESKPAPSSQSLQAQNPAMLEQMRTLSNSFNPMARLSSFSRGLTRINAPLQGGASPSPAPKTAEQQTAEGGDLATAFPDIASALPPKPKIAPPRQRFMELQNPGDLRLGEVLDLLRDYRRLAHALKSLDAFEDKT